MKTRLALAFGLALQACASSAPQQRQTVEPVAAPTPLAPEQEPAAPPDRPTTAYNAALIDIGDISQSQYVARNCASANIPDSAYEGFDVKRCVYEGDGLTAVVYALNPAAEDVARWVANACASVGRAEDEACARTLVKRMRGSNGFIFPVAGDVLEKAADAGPGCAARYGDTTVHVYFRDGVTIETPRGFTCETYGISQSDADAEAFAAPAQVFNVARIATLARADYARRAGVPRPSDDEWRAISRDSYLEALRGGRYLLLDMVAADLFGG